MANGKYVQGRKEEKIVDLISEYGTLQIEQMQQFFTFEEDIRLPLRNVVKRGRAVVLEEEGLVKVHKEIEVDPVLMKCFWIVVDLAEDVEYHFRGTYPMLLTFYSNGQAYEVFYCAQGEETAVSHAIRQREVQEREKRIIVIEEESQMERINLPEAVFCVIGEKGEVVYYE